MKSFLHIVIFCSVILLLTSCTSSREKETAYSFSMVFEKENEMPKITIYCKTPSNENSEQGTLTENLLYLSGTTFAKALENASVTDYDVYCKSTKAVFFSNEISDKDKTDIITFFFNHTKYRPDVYIYLPKHMNTEIDELHKKAAFISNNEKISPSQMNEFTSAVKELRRINNKRNQNIE